MNDPVSITLLIFVLAVIITCTFVDIFKVSSIDPLPLPFRLRRFINWFLLGLGYSAIYIGRYNFTLLTEERITKDISLSSSSYGWILSIGYWVYAFAAPLTGSVGDYFGSKHSVVIGTMGSGLINVLLGIIILIGGAHALPPTFLFGTFNALNFILQSLATGSVNKINSGWYKKSDLGLFGGIFSSVLATAFFFTLNVGTAIVHSSLHWAFLFILPGAFLIICSTLILINVKEKPYQAGWTQFDFTSQSTTPLVVKLEREEEREEEEEKHHHNHNNTNHHQDEEEENEIGIVLTSIHKENGNNHPHENLLMDENEEEAGNSYNYSSDNNNMNNGKKKSFIQVIKTITKEVLQKENIEPVFSRDNILNAMCLFCCGWIKEGFISWFIPFLNYKFPDASTSLISISSAGVTVGAILGGLLCGLLSDYVFHSKRSPALFIFFVFMNICIVILYFITNQIGAVLVLYLILLLILGANNVLAVTALLDIGVSRNASLMAGILTCCQYTASGFSGFLLGYIVEHLGFSGWMISMLPFGIGAMIMMAYNGIGDLFFWKGNKWKMITLPPTDKDINVDENDDNGNSINNSQHA